MRKVRRGILLLAIFLSLGGVAYKVTGIVQSMKKEIKKNPLKALDYLRRPSYMKDFHRSKIEEGRKAGNSSARKHSTSRNRRKP